MPFQLLARTRETTATVGTGAIVLGGALGQCTTFSANMANGDTTYACALSGDGVAWEEGVYTYNSSGNSLTRTTILRNHLGTTSPVTLVAGGRVFGIIPHDILGVLNNLLGPLDGQIPIFDSGLGRFVARFAGGVTWKRAVALATAAALPTNTYSNGTSGVGATLTATANAALTVDGVTVLVGYRILVKNEATSSHNGIYVVTQVGDGTHPYILTRATDHDDASDISQADVAAVGVAGTANGRTIWMSTIPSPFTLGTSTMTWSLVISLPPLTSNGDVLTIASGAVAWQTPSGGVTSAALDTLLGSTRGQLIRRGATAWEAIAPGSNGQLLAMGASDPAWAAPPTIPNVWPAIPTITSTGLDTWVNQGTSTIADDADLGIVLNAVNGSGDQLRSRIMSSPPSTPYKCRARMSFDFPQTNFQLFGFGFYNATTHHILALEFGEVSGLFGRIVKYDSTTSLNTNVSNIQTPNFYGPFWVEIEDDGTTVYLRMGISGKWFRQTSFSEARSSWMASSTQPIVYINAINNPSTGIISGWQRL